jgi:hypothetical protein
MSDRNNEVNPEQVAENETKKIKSFRDEAKNGTPKANLPDCADLDSLEERARIIAVGMKSGSHHYYRFRKRPS